MITIIYRLIIVFVLAMTVWNLFTEEHPLNQANAAMVVVPLILRALMIK